MNKIRRIMSEDFSEKSILQSELVKSQFILKLQPCFSADLYARNIFPKSICAGLTLGTFLLMGIPLFAQAEDVVFDGKQSHFLAKDPFPFSNNKKSIFPLSGWSNNTVTVVSGTITGNVYGGATNSSQEASNNSVVITGGDVQGVYGGRSNSGSVTGNRVIISGGAVTSVYGGANDTGKNNVTGNSVTGNSVTISGGKITDRVLGGWNSFGDANGNSVTISDGVIGSQVLGGYSMSGAAVGNTVTFSGGKVGGSGNSGAGLIGVISGGYSQRHNAESNSVAISGGEVGIVYGGRSASFGNATGNTVVISGGDVKRSVYGGYSQYGNATGNTVVISGMPQFSAANTSLYGGSDHSGAGDSFTGNILKFSAAPISVTKVANFMEYSFTLNPKLANLSTALINAEKIVLGDSKGKSSTIAVVGIHSGPALEVNDKFILMRATEIQGNGVGGVSTYIAQQGISLLYDVRTDVSQESNEVTATIIARNNGASKLRRHGHHDENPVARINPQLKAFSTSHGAGVQLVARGADMIAEEVFGVIDLKEQEQGRHLFAVVSDDRARYDNGSRIKPNNFLFTAGVNYQQDSLAIGTFVEGGLGSYKTYNSFHNATNVRGDGENYYFGAGFLGRYGFGNGFYSDATVRFGRSHNKFDTKNIRNFATGQFAKYNLNSNYVSAHVGFGYDLFLSEENKLDLSTKYLWARLGGKDVNVAGDAMGFDSINSQRIRVNAIFKHQYSRTLALNTGLGYEYEFDGKAKTTTLENFNVVDKIFKGGTGIFSIGATMNSDSIQRLSMDIKANGYTGRREGFGGSARLTYAF